MERLTERNPSWIDDEMWERACEPDCEEIDAVYRKLKDYEDAEEQGLLLRLPCRVGTIVYVLQSDRIIKVIITRYDCFKDGSIWFCFNHGCGKSIAEFGKTVFLTREEAEVKLKETEDANVHECD